MTTFGEVSWNDKTSNEKKSSNSKDIWLRLDPGDNEIRLVTAPFQYLQHKYKKDVNDKKDFGQKVYCSAAHGSCPLCETGDKAKPRWLLGVISRKTGTFKILDVSWAVFSQIKKLAQNTQRWGDPTKYDINIVVDRNGGATGYYSVQPLPKEPLSAEDQKIKDNVDLDDMKRRVTPPTPEQVKQRLDKINGVTTDSSNKNVSSTKVTQAVNLSDDEEDLSDSFPAYNE